MGGRNRLSLLSPFSLLLIVLLPHTFMAYALPLLFTQAVTPYQPEWFVRVLYPLQTGDAVIHRWFSVDGEPGR